MALDVAAVRALVTAAVTEALTAVRATTGGGGSGAGANIHKHYTRVEKFNGEDWKEWHHQFFVATHAYNSKNGALLEIVEQKELDEITTANIELELTQGESNWMHGSKAELFSVLTLLTKWEANQLVRSCEDLNGYTAWKKLYDRFNPKTPASLTAAWREVIRPKKLRDLREAGKAVDLWESKVVLLKKEHGEEPTAGLKASLLLEMLPESVQLTVAQGMSSKKLDFESLKTKIKLMASVQTDYATPKAMDIGETEDYRCDYYQEDVVDAVGAKGKGKGPMYGSCWTCGGSHFSRDCPKGAGKGAKSAGKGDVNGKGKGRGKSTGPMFGSCWTCGGAHFSRDCQKGSGEKGGGKSKGKGFRCHNCGGEGHRADQCPSAVREVEEDEEEMDGGEVGSVTECWDIFGLEEGRGRRRRGGRPGRGARWPGRPLALRNRYELLGEVEEVGGHDYAGLTDVAGAKGDIGSYCTVGEDCLDDLNCSTGVNCTACTDGVIGLDGSAADVDWIQLCGEKGEGSSVAKGEIVIDSGAAESVCPWDWAKQFPVREVRWDQKRSFRNASGGKMDHYGEKQVRCGLKGLHSPVNMLFQVSDVKNPLASVARITEKGNIVQFGPRDEDNYVFNPRTEEKVMMRRKGRKFVLDVNFLAKDSFFSGQA